MEYEENKPKRFGTIGHRWDRFQSKTVELLSLLQEFNRDFVGPRQLEETNVLLSVMSLPESALMDRTTALDLVDLQLSAVDPNHLYLNVSSPPGEHSWRLFNGRRPADLDKFLLQPFDDKLKLLDAEHGPKEPLMIDSLALYMKLSKDVHDQQRLKKKDKKAEKRARRQQSTPWYRQHAGRS